MLNVDPWSLQGHIIGIDYIINHIVQSKIIGIGHQDVKCKCSHGESILKMLFIAGLILSSDFGKLTQLIIHFLSILFLLTVDCFSKSPD